MSLRSAVLSVLLSFPATLLAAEGPDTWPASDVTGSSVTLNGGANPDGALTYAWFQWGTSTNYGNVTETIDLGSGSNPTNFSTVVDGLHPATQYHFRTVATNDQGLKTGPDMTFTTLPGFAAVSIPDLPAIDSSSVAWGDYNNDGLLDLLMIGTTNGLSSGSIAQLWANTGSSFTNVPISGLPAVIFGSVSWSDFDNDGKLDFLIMGTTNGIGTGVISQLWRNTGNGFANVTSTLAPGLPNLNQGITVWGDFNNDGRPDFLIVGFSSAGRTSQIWVNNGQEFTNATSTLAPGLAGVGYSSASTADFNNDGRLDFLISGELPNGDQTSQLWQNTDDGFVDVTSSLVPGLPGVVFGSSAWGDWDNDGREDFILTGESSTGRVAQVWHNTGSGFTNMIVPGLAGTRYSSVAWGDHDNDGLRDLLVVGNSANGTVAELWRNTGSGFTNAEAGLPGTFSFATGSSAFADYNNDGRLDVLLTGNKIGGGRRTELWQSFGFPENSAPAAPKNLSAQYLGGLKILSWSKPVDDQPSSSLGYNIRVGTSPGASDVVGPQADLVSGFRRLPAIGNTQLRTNALLKLPPGTYYWSVQAVDSALAGGAFAAEETFEVASTPTLSILRSGTSVIVSWQPDLPGWILQQSSGVSSNWSDVLGTVENPATFPITQENRFFRLHKP